MFEHQVVDTVSTSNNSSAAFHKLLAGLEAEHLRELEEVRRSLETQIEILHAQLKSPELGNHEPTKAVVCVNQGGTNSVGEKNQTSLHSPVKDQSTCDFSKEKADMGFVFSGGFAHQFVASHLESKQRDKRAQILNAHVRKAEKTLEHSTGHRSVKRVVNSMYFENFSACMILINSVLLGIAIDLDFPSEEVGFQKSSQRQDIFKTIEHIFTGWFFIEIVLRGLAEGIGGFCFFSSNTRWNLFDSLIVFIDFFQLAFDSGKVSDSAGASITILRLLRIFRVARAIRVIRLVKFFTELRLMVLSIMKSGTSLLWTMVLLSLIIYMFGILLMSMVSSYLVDKPHVSNRDDLIYWWGSLPRAGYTLFMCISGGISWVEISDPLIDIHWTNGLIVSFFIFFTAFSMLNIITGIFVESTRGSVQNDKDEVIREHLTNEKGVLKKLEFIFHQADTKHLGSITIEDFEGIMQNPETHALMSTLGLDVNEARGMFNLMDTSRSGHVGIEEFLIGCIRMKGGAKAVDLVTLMFENKKLTDTLSNFVEYAEEEFKRSLATEASTLNEVRLLKKALQPQMDKHRASNESFVQATVQSI